ncbi:MFS transporter [Acidilobus saccharovorans]|nr:MFS transporter [Acidilobus saccharovorans]
MKGRPDDPERSRGVMRISLYNLVNGMTSSAYSPYLSFIGASLGLSGYTLGIVSTAGTFFTNMAQYFSSVTRSRARLLVLEGNLVRGLGLFLMLFFLNSHIIYTILVAVIMAGSGVSSMGLSLLSEYYSRGSRSIVLSRMAFYSALGSLPVIVAGGLYMATNVELAKYIFVASAVVTTLSTFIVFDLPYDEPQGRRSLRLSAKGLEKFLAFNFVYMIVWSFAWPLFPLSQIYIFKMTTEQVAIINVIATSSTVVVQRFIGGFIARRMKLSMFLGRLTNTFFALAYAVSPNIYGIYVSQLLAGLANSINNVAYFSYLVDKVEDKRAAIGTYSVVMGVGALIGGELGGWAFEYLKAIEGYECLRQLMLYTAIARASAASLFLLL